MRVLSLAAVLSSASASASSSFSHVYVGSGACDGEGPTCTAPGPTPNDVISQCKFNEATGELDATGSYTAIITPSWLKEHPTNSSILFATEEAGTSLYALKIIEGDSENVLTPASVTTYLGAGAVHLTFDVTKKYIFPADYYNGKLSAVPFDDAGTLGAPTDLLTHYGHGPNAGRQEAAHIHSTLVTAKAGSDTNSIIYAMDLGVDRIFWYDFDPASGKFTNGTGGGVDGTDNFVWSQPGCGPRHALTAIVADGTSVLIVLNELESAIETWAIDPVTGSLGVDSIAKVSMLKNADLGADPVTVQKAAELLYSADERFVYASNRGVDSSIVVFSIDAATGALTLVQRMPTHPMPRGVGLATPERLLVGGQNDGIVATYAIDTATGLLTYMTQAEALGTPAVFAFI